MYWIWQFIVSHRYITSLIITVGLSLFMITAGKQKQQNIAKTLTLTIFSPVQLMTGSLYQFNNILSENKKLREKIVVVELENAELRVKLDEIKSLDTAETSHEIFERYEIISASIVAREPSFFYRTAVINIGANQGVKNSMSVISNGGVVGKVVSVLPLTSLIQMIYGPDEYISIEHKSGAVGILESKIDGSLFANVRSISEVEVGDTLWTTGLGGVYPRGLKVGVIQKIESSKDGDIFKKIHIKSSIDFDKLRKVFIVKSEPQWEAIKEEIIRFKED
jgi:rod shape-determining protein MreC